MLQEILRDSEVLDVNQCVMSFKILVLVLGVFLSASAWGVRDEHDQGGPRHSNFILEKYIFQVENGSTSEALLVALATISHVNPRARKALLTVAKKKGLPAIAVREIFFYFEEYPEVRTLLFQAKNFDVIFTENQGAFLNASTEARTDLLVHLTDSAFIHQVLQTFRNSNALPEATLDVLLRFVEKYDIESVRVLAAEIIGRQAYPVTRPDLIKRITKLRNRLPQASAANHAPVPGAYRAAGHEAVGPTTRVLQEMRANLNLVRFEEPQTKIVARLRKSRSPREQVELLNRLRTNFYELTDDALREIVSRTTNAREETPGFFKGMYLRYRGGRTDAVENLPEVRAAAAELLRERFTVNGVDLRPERAKNVLHRWAYRQLRAYDEEMGVPIASGGQGGQRVRVSLEDSEAAPVRIAADGEEPAAEEALLEQCAAESLARRQGK